MKDKFRKFCFFGVGLLVASAFTLSLFASFRGLRFGYHWDESFHVWNVTQSIEKGVFLPSKYFHSTLCYWVVLSRVAPQYWSALKEAKWNHAAVKQKVLNIYQDSEFYIQMRKWFSVVGLLAILVVFLLGWKWSGSLHVSLLASLILAGSFEYHYHARWITPDSILSTFGVLSLTFSLAYLKGASHRCLYAAAIFAAFACASKVSGGVFLLPGLFSVFLRGEVVRRWDRARSLLGYLFLFLFVYLLLTPGAYIEPAHFLGDIEYQLNHYKQGHFGYSVRLGEEALKLNSLYLSNVALSHFEPIAVVFCGWSVIGLLLGFYREWRASLLLLLVPLCFLYLFSQQRTMVVRNLLCLIPILALFAAYGISEALRFTSLKLRFLRSILLVTTYSCMAINLGWIVYAGETIRKPLTGEDLGQLTRELIRKEPEKTFLISKSIFTLLTQTGDLPSNVQTHLDPSLPVPDLIVYLSSQDLGYPDRIGMSNAIANRRGVYQSHSRGPQDVNLDYYPTWEGNERPVVLTFQSAVEMSLVALFPKSDRLSILKMG